MPNDKHLTPAIIKFFNAFEKLCKEELELKNLLMLYFDRKMALKKSILEKLGWTIQDFYLYYELYYYELYKEEDKK